MSEEYSEGEEETNVETEAEYFIKEVVSLDVVFQIHDLLQNYTTQSGLPLLNSYGSAIDLYETIRHKTS